MSYEFGLELVVKRAEILRSDPTQPGGMAIIAATKEIISQQMHQLGLGNRLVIAVFNGPESHVVSGEVPAVESLLAYAKAHGLRGAKLNVEQGIRTINICKGLL